MALPTELDFVKNPEASPSRMNSAMEYLIARLRAVEALTPEFESSINLLRQVGLERLAEVLVPIFEDANTTAALIDALREEYSEDTFKNALKALVTADVIEEFADYRNHYLGPFSVAPTLDGAGDAVAIGATYFDTTLNEYRVLRVDGWKAAGSTVTGTMATFALTATAAQTVFTIPGGYDVGNLIVFVDGVGLNTGEYVATNGTTITLAAQADGTSVSGVKFGAVTIATVYSKTESDAKYRTIAGSYSAAQVDTALSGKAATADVYSKIAADARYFRIANDLSESGNTAALRTALGLGALAVLASVSDSTFTGLLSVAKGGTGVSSLAALLANLSAMVGASSGAGGTKGLVPAPAAGDEDKVLHGDGTWRTAAGVFSGRFDVTSGLATFGNGLTFSYNYSTHVLTVSLVNPAASSGDWAVSVQAQRTGSTNVGIATKTSQGTGGASFTFRVNGNSPIDPDFVDAFAFVNA